jgi:CBS domain-containing protein
MARYGNDFSRGRQGGYGDRSGYDLEFGGRDEGGMRGGRMGGGGGRGYDREFGSGGGGGFQGGMSRGFGSGGATSGGYRGGGGQGGGFSGGGYGGGYGGGQGGGYGDRGWETGHRGRDDAGLERMRASQIMTDDPEFVTPDTTISEVAKKMRDLDVGIMPICESQDNRRLRGVVTDRDIAIRVLAEGKDGRVKVQEVMTDQVDTVNKNDSVRDVLELMQREQVRRIPVTDREGRLVGIIAQADVAVDLMEEGGRDRKRMVARTLERVSQPGRPERSGRGRGGGGGRARETQGEQEESGS